MTGFTTRSLSIAEAAALYFGGTTTLYFLNKVDLQPGESVLVNDAAGGVGTTYRNRTSSYFYGGSGDNKSGW